MGRFMRVLYLPLLLIVLLLGVLIGLDNSQPVELSLLNWQSPRLPVFIWLLLALVLGVLLGMLASLPERMRQRRRIRQLQKQRPSIR